MFLVRLRFFNNKEGGRNTPPLSGYGPQIRIGNEYTSCILTAQEHTYIFDFNQEHEAFLELRSPERYAHLLQIGDKLDFFEGPKHVGEGTIIA